VAETCRHRNKLDKSQMCFDVTHPSLICIEHNGDRASNGVFIVCCEKSTKYLNKVREGETKSGALIQILRVILR